MDSDRLLEFLAVDVGRLREAAGGDLSAPVPSCPGWTLADLLRHVAHGYLNVVIPQLRRGEATSAHDLTQVDPLAALEQGYAAMLDEIAAYERREDGDRDLAAFWIRRMAHETAMHRIDADLTLGRSATPIAAELAVDGVDELLTVFLARETTQWTEQYASELTDWAARRLVVSTDAAAWRIAVRLRGVEVVSVDPAQILELDCAARIDSEPDTFLRWAYNRPSGEQIVATGDEQMIEQFKRLLTAVTGVG